MSNSTTKKPRVTTEDFIIRAIRKHGDSYDYSDTVYVRNNQKLNIRCKTHGIFEQIAGNHLNGNGCPKCGGVHQRTESELIDEFNKVHNSKYDYSNMGYSRMSRKIKINCPDHGVFTQLPSAHLRGDGCHKCSGVGRRTQDEMIAEFVLVHGNRYIYDDVLFDGVDKKVKIRCRVHGVFEQAPYNHAKGLGCKICGYVKQSRTAKKDLAQFVKMAKEVHGEKYDYSKSIYRGAKNKIKIICREHGEFYQNASSHLCGTDCPLCATPNRSGFARSSYIEACNKSKNGKSNLYVIRLFSDDESFFKVGITSLTVESRFSRMLEYKYEVIHFLSGDAGYIWDLEKSIHRLLKSWSYHPKKSFDGKTECFSVVTKEVTKPINSLKSTQQFQLIA